MGASKGSFEKMRCVNDRRKDVKRWHVNVKETGVVV